MTTRFITNIPTALLRTAAEEYGKSVPGDALGFASSALLALHHERKFPGVPLPEIEREDATAFFLALGRSLGFIDSVSLWGGRPCVAANANRERKRRAVRRGPKLSVVRP